MSEPAGAAELFKGRFGGTPDGVWVAPGRANLMGEHTDYNDGFVLPFALSQATTAAAARRTDGRLLLSSRQEPGGVVEIALDGLAPGTVTGWGAYPAGVAWALRSAGYQVPGACIAIDSDVPAGAGLSSSAALEVALCLALLALTTDGAPADRLGLARLCSRVENDWVGARTGLLDQLASLYGEPDTALLIDFRTLELVPVPLRLYGGWRLVTLDSGERHTNARSGYNERRAECAAACELLGVASLREASPGAVDGLPEPLRRRASHVLGENARVRETVAALRAEDLPAVGRLLNASHASLRDLFEVSSTAVERAVEELLAAGAAGARIMGGGFGGHVLGLLAPEAAILEGAREVRSGPGAHLLDR